VTAPVDVPLGSWLASFDGRVFEVFVPYPEGSVRYLVLLLVDFRIDGSTLTADFQRKDIGLWPFTEDQRPGVEALVAEVNAVRAAAR
jgi:hypothetical protein